MKSNAGLWIDHREAVIVVLSEAGEETKRIQSGLEKKIGRPGEPSNGQVHADDLRQRESTGHLARYYDEIASHLREAGSILILGPGEAKGELKKRLEEHKSGARAIALEAAGRMTEPQVVARVRRHFHLDAARRGV